MKKLKIVYEDKNIIVVDKEAGLLTIASNKERNRTLYNEVRDYVKKQYPKNKIFIIHRLDKDTSGLVVFAKNEKTKFDWQNNWDKVDREYYAIVEGKLKGKGRIKVKLYETKNLEVVVNEKLGKECITDYEVIKSNDKYSLLNIKLVTGRRNQIRASLKHIGYPIIGDKKYNDNYKKNKRLGLYAYRIRYNSFDFISELPKEFAMLFK